MAANLNSALGSTTQHSTPADAYTGGSVPGMTPAQGSASAKTPPTSGTSATSGSGSGTSVVAAAAEKAGKGVLKALEKAVTGSATATPG